MYVSMYKLFFFLGEWRMKLPRPSGSVPGVSGSNSGCLHFVSVLCFCYEKKLHIWGGWIMVTGGIPWLCFP